MTDDAVLDKTRPPARRKLFQLLGPGLVTGASDDDPSGIATYSQVGAQFGYGLAWTLVFSYPLMAAIQEISARIGRVTGFGIAGNLRRHYPAWLSGTIVLLLLIANLINLGADLSLATFAEPLVAPPSLAGWQSLWSSEDPRYGGSGTPAVDRDGAYTLPAESTVVLQATSEGTS